MLIFFVILLLVTIAPLFFNYFIKDMRYVPQHIASAGAHPSEKAITPVLIDATFTDKAKNLKLVQIHGNSAIKVGIKDTDIVAIDGDYAIKNLKQGDILYLEYENYPNKFKIREFVKLENEIVFSKTTKNHGQYVSSQHNQTTYKGIIKYHAIAA